MESNRETITLAGREFEMHKALTAAQEMFMQGQLRAAGVTEILSKPDATLATHGEEILTALLMSGRAEFIFAAMLVEAGKPWRREDAISNAEDFGGVTDPKEKALLHTILFGVVAGFFEQGGKSLMTSPNFSQANSPDAESAPDGVSAAREI